MFTTHFSVLRLDFHRLWREYCTKNNDNIKKKVFTWEAISVYKAFQLCLLFKAIISEIQYERTLKLIKTWLSILSFVPLNKRHLKSLITFYGKFAISYFKRNSIISVIKKQEHWDLTIKLQGYFISGSQLSCKVVRD